MSSSRWLRQLTLNTIESCPSSTTYRLLEVHNKWENKVGFTSYYNCIPSKYKITAKAFAMIDKNIVSVFVWRFNSWYYYNSICIATYLVTTFPWFMEGYNKTWWTNKTPSMLKWNETFVSLCFFIWASVTMLLTQITVVFKVGSFCSIFLIYVLNII